jgi:AcrR family transcriptional regulator
MTRTADERRRSRLRERVVEYVLQNGLGGLSLRPLAKALRTSPRMLLYYFKSKEALVVEVLQEARERQRRQFTMLKEQSADSAIDACRAIWAIMSAPKAEPVFRLFFETYALALRDPKGYPGFLKGAIEDWVQYIHGWHVTAGYARTDARALATIVLAGYRGFLLDLIATHDRARIDRAVDLWLRLLPAVPSPKELDHDRDRPRTA